jgi:hypothetical protein
MLVQRHTTNSEFSPSNNQPPHHALGDTGSLAANVRKQENQVYIAIRGIQSDLRRNQLADTDVSNSHRFRFCAPLAIFLYFFIVGVTVPRNPAAKAYIATLMESLGSLGILIMLLVLGVGAALVLVILWAMIWLLVGILRWFCEWDLTELNDAGANQYGEYQLSQGNLLFGGLFT